MMKHFRLPVLYHERLWAVTDQAEVMYVRGAALSAEQNTSGFIADEVLHWLTRSGPRRAVRIAAELVEHDLWARVDGGYVMDDWRRWRLRRSARAYIPTAVRLAVYERDGYACRHCGALEPLSLDHIFPWSLGGCDDIDNLQTLCLPCNIRKGARV